MKTLEELSHRLSSVRDMRSVVSTMKSLAAASIRQYETAVDATREYDRVIELALQVLLHDWQPYSDIGGSAQLFRPQEEIPAGRFGVILFGTDQGLCGRFNDEIANHALQFLESGQITKRPVVLVVGARLTPLLGGLDVEHSRTFHVPANVADITSLLQFVMPEIDAWQRARNVQRIEIFYNRRLSTSSYEPTRQPLLPIDPEFLNRLSEEPWNSRGLPVYRSPHRELLSGVVQQYLFLQLFRACAESRASENASRIASMQRAEKNIEKKLIDLQSELNQQRQNSITEELLDILTGVVAND